jgi:hypothetical protein
VTFDVKALRNGATVQVNGSIPVVFADWGIPSPSFGPAEVGDHGGRDVGALSSSPRRTAAGTPGRRGRRSPSSR